MPRSQVIREQGSEEFVTAEPEEVDALREAGMVTTSLTTASDATVRYPFYLDDVMDSLKEMRSPDVV